MKALQIEEMLFFLQKECLFSFNSGNLAWHVCLYHELALKILLLILFSGSSFTSYKIKNT